MSAKGHYLPVKHRETQKQVIQVPGLGEEDKSGDQRETYRGHVIPVDASGKRIVVYGVYHPGRTACLRGFRLVE